eukprot:6005179-Amphidinium_carterae.1
MLCHRVWLTNPRYPELHTCRLTLRAVWDNCLQTSSKGLWGLKRGKGGVPRLGMKCCSRVVCVTHGQCLEKACAKFYVKGRLQAHGESRSRCLQAEAWQNSISGIFNAILTWEQKF